MDCNCNKEKRSYHFNISEVVDGKIQEVMNFNFGGHHDLAAMVAKTAAKGPTVLGEAVVRAGSQLPG